jgi:inner membrane protein
MDSLTHIATGALVGELFFERGFGKKAMIWGALAQSIPDIDFISALWLSPGEAMVAHRGFTHSFLFALLIGPVFTLLADKIHKPHNIRMQRWLLFFYVELFLHLLLDACNTYGIGWFLPFDHRRLAFNLLFVADVLFMLPPILAFVVLWVKNRYDLSRRRWATVGLLLPFLYLGLTSLLACSVYGVVEKNIAAQQIRSERWIMSPAPFQNLLWYVVVEQQQKFLIGYYSVMDYQQRIDFHSVPKHHTLDTAVHDHPEYQTLKRFSDGWYTLRQEGKLFWFSDLRFGQRFGWEQPANDFVFNWKLSHTPQNRLHVQQGRFAGWQANQVHRYFLRIFGRSSSRRK